MIAADATLRLDERDHRAFLGNRELIRTTTALADVGLIDARYFTDESRVRGTYLHDAVTMHFDGDLEEASIDPLLRPYWDGFRRFLKETRFQAHSVERPVYDDVAGYAGRYDLFGTLPDQTFAADDLIDVKTGTIPSSVVFQTIAYRRRLASRRCRRWALGLPGNGTYRLVPLNLTSDRRSIDTIADRQHESVFLAAVTVARHKRGL